MQRADHGRSPPRANAGGQLVAQNLGNTDAYTPCDWRAQRLARRFRLSAHVAALLATLAYATDGSRA